MTDAWSGSDLPFDATGASRPGSAAAIGANGFLTAPEAPAGTPRHSGSRWRGDSVNFGGWGRLVATVVLLLPVAWMVSFMGIGGALFLMLYVFIVLPVALRDVWRRTRVSLPPPPPTAPRAP